MLYRLIVYTCMQATCSVLGSLLVGLVCVHTMVQVRSWATRLLVICVPVVCMMPTKLLVMSIDQCIPLTGFWGIVVTHVWINGFYAAYIFTPVYQYIHTQYLDVAQSLGASIQQVYVTIIWPLLVPTVIYATAIIFLLCFSSHSIPPLLATAWYHLTPDAWILSGPITAYPWVLYVIKLALALIAMYSFFVDKKARASYGQITQRSVSPCLSTNGYVGHGIVLVLSVFAVIPLLSFLYVCWVHNAYMHEQWHALVSAYGYSVGIAWLSASSAVLLAAVCACALYMTRNTRWWLMMLCICLLPYACSSYGIRCLQSWVLIGGEIRFMIFEAVAHALLYYLHIMIYFIVALSAWRREWMYTARMYGASYGYIVRTILLPLAMPSLVRAWVMAFGFSFTETLLWYSDEVTTLSRLIKGYRALGDMHGVLVGSLLVCGTMMVVTGIYEWHNSFYQNA